MNVLDDEDDDFLYGSSSKPVTTPAPPTSTEGTSVENATREEDDSEDMDEEDSDDDIEIITDGPVQAPTAPKNILDFRNLPNKGALKGTGQTTLTTEYRPLERESATAKKTGPSSVQSATAPAASEVSVSVVSKEEQQDLPDPSTLPVAVAAPSAPKIDLNKDGLLDGRSIFEVDMSALENKTWRRPGSDLSDWFNYGFDELSWEAYCVRRRELGEMAPILKSNVLAFSSMSEEQVSNLPNDIRGMVMMSSHMAAQSMGTAGPPNMMGGGNSMHPDMMMNMGMMSNMGGPMQQPGVGPGVDMSGNSAQMMMQGMVENDGPAMGGAPMMQGLEYQTGQPMGMGQEYIQEPNVINQPGGFGVDTPPTAPAASAGRGLAYRGRVQPTAPRGRGAFRGRGRGAAFDTPPPTAPRAASPLPPNVPTGPRNQHRYKDRDTGAPTSEPLDYGGDARGSADKPLRDEFGRDIERPGKDDDPKSGRKRRGSPPEDVGRLKRR